MKVDAIVTSASTSLMMGGGLCETVFRAAGAVDVQAVCSQLGPIEVGQAVVTPGFALAAKHIILTAVPGYRGGRDGEAELLRSCYLNSLYVAALQQCRSIAFPLLSSGMHRYPRAEALYIAVEAIMKYLEHHDMEVYLVVFPS